VRGSRRSIATRSRRIAPDASRSRRLRYEKAAGPFPIPSASKDPLESPTPRHGRAPLAGTLTLWESCSSLNQPAGGTPTTLPDRSRGKPKRTFRQPIHPQSCPQGPTAACPIRRPAQGRERIDRKAGLDERRLAFHPVCVLRGRTRARRTQHRTIGAPCGRQSPADSVCFPVLLACTRPLDKPKPTQGTGQPGNPTLSRIKGSV
jgi:hypothetical protein